MKIDFPSEKIIEDYVWERLEETGDCPISGEIPDYYFRQREIKGYGVSDIIKVCVAEEAAFVTVLELKNEPLKAAHVEQLCRYLVGVNRIAERYRRRGFKVNVRGQLAGPFESNDIVYLIQWMHPAISLYDLDLTMEFGFRARLVSRNWYSKAERLLSGRDLTREFYNLHLDHKDIREAQDGTQAPPLKPKLEAVK